MNTNRLITFVLAAFLGLGVVTGCQVPQNPCSGLSTPSKSEVKRNKDIEVKLPDGRECDYERGRWRLDED